jgi:HNH endonuclease
MGADVLERVEERWASDHRALGQCLVWTGVVDSRGEYGRLYDPAIKRTDYTHRIVWRRVFGPIPDGLEVDEVCAVSLCVRPDHLQLLTKGDNG